MLHCGYMCLLSALMLTPLTAQTFSLVRDAAITLCGVLLAGFIVMVLLDLCMTLTIGEGRKLKRIRIA